MEEIERVAPEEARKRILHDEALLVCAYDNEDKFRRAHLEGAISLKEVSGLSKETEIIFYCA